jgi:hypothetical protein
MSGTLPVVQCVIARRILVNFRVRPEVIAPLLPAPFRPQQVKGWAVAGICLIRLEHLRPKGLPAAFGISTENAAHRIAVEWTDAGGSRTGVFIPRRETNTTAIALAGGRLFPGEHHSARFDIKDDGAKVQLNITSGDGQADVRLSACVTDQLPPGSLFKTVDEASAFFHTGNVGCSPNRRTGRIEVMELRTQRWEMHPLQVEQVHSSWFANPQRFPAGSLAFDSAFVMRAIDHEWHALENLLYQMPEERQV